MPQYFEDTAEVVELVIRFKSDDGYRYLFSRRKKNGYWEFVGGKRKKDEGIEHAVHRELEDEIEVEWEEDDFEVEKVGEPYDSPDNPVYSLYPVLVEVPKSKAVELESGDLSREHDKLEWIDIEELEEYENIGQRKALEILGLV